MPRSIQDTKSLRVVSDRDPDYDKIRINNLETQVGALTQALVDVQHRVAKLGGGRVDWPGDTYGPTDD